MKPILSYIATLILMGVVFTLLHLLIVWFGASDLVALLLYGAPISAYIAYCTHRSRPALIRAGLQIYASFSLVVIAAAALVYLIGQ